MQPSNPDYSNYEEQGFTQVPGGYPSDTPQTQFTAPQQEIPPQSIPAGMPPSYAAAPSGWEGQAEPYPDQDEYAQEMYQPVQQAPFQGNQMPYQAPRTPHYNRLNMILVVIIGALVIILGSLALSQRRDVC